MEKEHFEILREEMRGKFDLVLEGHAVLREEIRQVRDESNAKHDHTAFFIGTLNQKIDTVEERLSERIDHVEATLTRRIDAVAADLSAHRADTEGHKGVFVVRER